jgi:nucleotidyltransferase/DNA polymerase involved in DNA repair
MKSVGSLQTSMRSSLSGAGVRPGAREAVAIVPIDAVTACCIAASYQAKAYGVKTCIRLDEALLSCTD